MNRPEPAIVEGIRQAGSKMSEHFLKHALSPRRYGPRASIRAVEMGAIGLWMASASWSAAELGRAALSLGPSSWLVLGLSGVLGWLLADALSGAVHYFADNFGQAHWPLLGPALIASFREHHDAPRAITSHDLVERSGMLCFAGFLLAGWVGPFLHGSLSTPLRVGLSAVALSTAVWIALSGEIHAWAHGLPTPAWGRFLQRLGLVLVPKQHSLHHVGNHASHYCITSGFWDRLRSGKANHPLVTPQEHLDFPRPLKD
jgi:plasmanylethanolamine desaturase